MLISILLTSGFLRFLKTLEGILTSQNRTELLPLGLALATETPPWRPPPPLAEFGRSWGTTAL